MVAVHHALWQASSETVTLLNKHAGWFFGTVQRSLINGGGMLGIFPALRDPPGSGDKTNLVISELLLDPLLANKPESRD